MNNVDANNTSHQNIFNVEKRENLRDETKIDNFEYCDDSAASLSKKALKRKEHDLLQMLQTL